MTGPEPRDLRQATMSGVRWIALSRVFADGAVLVVSIPLARLLSPEEFGRAAVALVIVAVAAVLGPGGMTAPLVQRKVLGRAEIAVASSLCLVTGALFTLLTWLFARAAAGHAFGPETARLIELAAPAWILSAIGAVPVALLQRELRFSHVALVDAVSVVVGTATSLAGALVWSSAEVLVVGGLITVGVSSALGTVLAGVHLPGASISGLRAIGAFSLIQTASGLMWTTFRNIDYAILGARMSAVDVGLYWRAYQLSLLQPGKISQIMQRIAFPVYSRSPTHEEVLRLRMRITRLHAVVLLPLLAAFAAIAPLGIPVVFGNEWEGAVVPAQIMAIAGMCEALLTGTGPLLTSMGRAGVLLASNALAAVVYAATVFALAPFGLVTVAWGVAAFSVLDLVLTQIVLLGPIAKVPHRQFLREAWPGVAVAGTLFVGVTAARGALDAVPDPASLGLLVAVSVTGYVLLMRFAFPAVWGDLMRLTGRLRGAGGAG